MISQSEIGDANRVRLSGPGLSEGRTFEPSEFIIDTRDAGMPISTGTLWSMLLNSHLEKFSFKSCYQLWIFGFLSFFFVWEAILKSTLGEQAWALVIISALNDAIGNGYEASTPRNVHSAALLTDYLLGNRQLCKPRHWCLHPWKEVLWKPYWWALRYV